MNNSIVKTNILYLSRERDAALVKPLWRFESNRSISRILIETPELEHAATLRKQNDGGPVNRQQTMVFAESYQTVYFRIPMQQELSSLMGK